MTNYAMLCLILYLLSHYIVMAVTPLLDCQFTAAKAHSPSKNYKCSADCRSSRKNPPDLNRVELDYRICTHPDIGGKTFRINKGANAAQIIIFNHKRNKIRRRTKRTLSLVPQWQSEPEGVSVDQGSSVTLYCSIQSVSDDVEYEWFYSDEFPSNTGDTLSDLYNGVGDGSGTLSITSASSGDAGYYQCKATDSTQDGDHVIYSNIVEVEIENYYLTTPDGLETETTSAFSAVDVLILECPDVESNPTATVTWYKDDELYSDQGAFVSPFEDDQTFDYNSESYTVKKNSLVLMAVTEGDNGVYKCRATNSKSGQYFDMKEYTVTNYASSDSELDNALPTILKESTVTVEEGTSATLYCMGVGHPNEMTYTWQKDGTDLTFSSTIVQSDYGRQVTFTSVADSDDDLYSCKCSNSAGDTTNYITLKVEQATTYSEIEITSAPNDFYLHDVYLGDSAADIVIPCVATGADQIRFLKNGELLENSDNYSFQQNVGLTFSSYNSSDSGVYQCVAFNQAYWKQKMTFVMITEQVSASASADVTAVDSVATLSCNVGGYPYPDVTWSHDGSTISNTLTSQSPYVVSSPPTHQLVITDIGFTDGGVYTCTAVSATLEDYDSIEDYSHAASDEVTLTIEEEIYMTASEDSVTATVDDTLELACTANGKPNPDEVVWYVNGTEIDTSSSDYSDRFTIVTKNVNDYVAYSTLEISGLQISDKGTYTCEASNTAVGTTTTDDDDTEVLIKYLAVSVDDSIREIASGQEVTIVCSAAGSPTPSEIRWYLGSTSGVQLDSSSSDYSITSVLNGTHYVSTLVVTEQTADQDYVCEATNYLSGTAQFDEVKILVRVYSEIDASRLASVVSTEVGVASALTCYCSGVPLTEEAVWKVGGVEVTTTSTRTITNTAEYDPDFQLTSVLSFSNPSSSDIAEYQCNCENSFEGEDYTDSVNVNFLVVTPVSMNWDTDNPKATPYDEELTLTCTATGIPVPSTIVWSRMLDTADSYSTISNGTRFSIVETVDSYSLQSVLTILSTQYADDGSYKCYAENEINDETYTADEDDTLLIYQNPTVTMATSEYAATTDSNAELSCTVSSKPAPNTMNWYFGDDLISSQPTSTSSGYDMTSNYTVNGVTSSTEGKYRCVGTHTYEGEEATGEGYTYVRLYRPYSSSNSPDSSTTVNEYTTLNLTCSATGVPEVAEFTWSIDSVLLTSDDITSSIGTIVKETDYERSDLNIGVTSVLMMDTVKYTNLGTYKCSSSQTWSGETNSTSHSFDVAVNFDAKLFSGTGTTEVTQDVGSQIRLTCEVYGNPAPDTITWKWADGVSISETDSSFTLNNYVINDYKKTSTLQFTFLPIYHEKDLQCISQNSLSPEEEKLQFTLNMNDDTMGIIQSGTVSTGETVSLTCLTTFNEGAISWYKDSTILEQNTRISFSTNTTYSTKNSVLTIEELSDSSDSGNYSCAITYNSTTQSVEYILALGGASTSTDGLSTGIIIALVVLVTFIVIVIILIIVVFVHGRKRREHSIFDEKSMPDGYENNAYDDRHLQSVISMPDTNVENLPKVVEPIMLSKNELDHDVKDATIMQQATLTQQRNPRYPGQSQTLDKRRPNRAPSHPSGTMDRRNKMDWY